MIIANLDFIELVKIEPNIIGGLFTSTDAKTQASSGIAYAHADALAVGSNTLTFAKIETRVHDNSKISSSRSSADVEARAWEGDSSSRSSTKSRSINVSTI